MGSSGRPAAGAGACAQVLAAARAAAAGAGESSPRRRGPAAPGSHGDAGGGGRVSGHHVVRPGARPYDPAALPRKPPVAAEAFFAADLRVGRVEEVQPFPEMRKPSYKLRVDFGPAVGSLWTSAQVTNYAEADLAGRTVVGAINLGERRLAGGFVSEFLVLGALESDGTVRLLEVPAGTPPGSAVA